jgi:hypothetical protein
MNVASFLRIVAKAAISTSGANMTDIEIQLWDLIPPSRG